MCFDCGTGYVDKYNIYIYIYIYILFIKSVFLCIRFFVYTPVECNMSV